MKRFYWLSILLVLALVLMGGCAAEQEPAAPEVETEMGVEAEPDADLDQKYKLRFANYFAGKAVPE